MLALFLKALAQKNDPQLMVQLLQSLSIIFENISNDMVMCECASTVDMPHGPHPVPPVCPCPSPPPDYLLSNNHINSMIAHKFDFDNEEVSVSCRACVRALWTCKCVYVCMCVHVCVCTCVYVGV